MPEAETDYGEGIGLLGFTQEIQLSEGLYIFHGLAQGWIVHVEDSNHEYMFKLGKFENLILIH